MRQLIAVIVVVLLTGCVSSGTRTGTSRARIYSADEHDVRMAICLSRIEHVKGEVWFVDESESFIEELRKRSGVAEIRHASLSRYDKGKRRPVDRHTGETGFKFSVSDVVISGNTAKASVSWYASPIGGEWHTVTLRTEGGQWLVSEWKLEAAA